MSELIDMTPTPKNLKVTQGNDITFLIGLRDGVGGSLIDLTNYVFRANVVHPRSGNIVGSVQSGSGIEIEPLTSNEYVRVIFPTSDTDDWSCYDKPYKWAVKAVTPAPELWEIDVLRGLVTVIEKLVD